MWWVCESKAKETHNVWLRYLSKLCFYPKFSTWHIHISIHTHIHTHVSTQISTQMWWQEVQDLCPLFPREEFNHPLVLLHHLQKTKKRRVKRWTLHKKNFWCFLIYIYIYFEIRNQSESSSQRWKMDPSPWQRRQKLVVKFLNLLKNRCKTSFKYL